MSVACLVNTDGVPTGLMFVNARLTGDLKDNVQHTWDLV